MERKNLRWYGHIKEMEMAKGIQPRVPKEEEERVDPRKSW